MSSNDCSFVSRHGFGELQHRGSIEVNRASLVNSSLFISFNFKGTSFSFSIIITSFFPFLSACSPIISFTTLQKVSVLGKCALPSDSNHPLTIIILIVNIINNDAARNYGV